MTGIDTNVVVRFLVADDPEQHARSVSLIASTACFVPDTVVLETVWVLRSSYGYSREQIIDALYGFLGLANVHLADLQRMQQALQWFSEGLDLADALHLASSQHTDVFVTFDQHFIARAAGKGTSPVEEPAAR